MSSSPVCAGSTVVAFDGSVRWLIVLLGSLTALGPLAIDMYLPSFPAIAEHFGAKIEAVQQTLASYFVGLALGQLFYGPAADRFGRKGPLYVGLFLFLAASMGCALAGSVHMLVALRFLQATGGCSAMLIARAVVRDRFEPRDAARMFSSLTLVMGLAPILAPLLGGWLVVHGGWRLIFWAQAGFATLSLLSVALFLGESLPPQRRHRHNLASAMKVYAGLITHRQFMVYTLATALTSAGMFAYIGGSPFVFIELHGVRPEHFGLFFGANALGYITASQINARLLRRWEPEQLLWIGQMVAAAAGLGLLVLAKLDVGGFIGIAALLFLFLSSLGLIAPNAVALALGPHGRNAGNASALIGSLQFMISGIGGLLVSLLHNGTAVPMAMVIAACNLTAMAIHLFWGRTRQTTS